MNIKNFIQLVEQADIPNMQVLGPLDDGFANIRYNGMAGVLDQQTNKMILISPKVPDSFHIVTVAGGRETTQYVGGSELGPATKKALDSITPRQRPRPPAPLPSQESYESTEQVRSIVQRMMEDARVPQKPRQGPLRPQTGAGKHKDKKKDQKQGKEKHKGKNLDESNIPFAGLGKHKIGQAGQLRSPGPTGYPKGKLVGGAAESRFGRNRDDQFSLGGRMPRTDRIDRDSSSGQDAQQRMERKLKQQTIDRLLDRHPEWERSDLELASLPELIQMLRENQSKKLDEGLPMADYTKYSTETLMNMLKILKKNPEKEKIAKAVSKELVRRSQELSEAVKKPNATTRHLRDYPVSDKDVAKPVKPEKKKDEKKAVAEMDNRTPAGDRREKRANSPEVQKQREKELQADLKKVSPKMRKKLGLPEPKEGVAEGYGPWGRKSPEDVAKIKRALEKEKKNQPGQLRRSPMSPSKTNQVDKFDQWTARTFSNVEEGKQKGVDGKACWKGYKRMGTKKKGGRTVDNCVKIESISEGILSSFGLMEKSPPGFKGTVKAMKKHPELTKGKTKDGKEKNPWALAWHMKNKGYKSHKKADGSNKD